MAASSYDEALRRVLVHEGGYTNHPSDPGGPTNFGITIHDYRRYVKPNASAGDVRAMRLAEAKAIYRSKYWNAMRCDELPAGVDYAVFDYGVNSGVSRAGKVLRRVLDLADDSYVVTDAVLATLRNREAVHIVVAICDERLAFLKRLKTWPVFGKGWGPRVVDVRAAGTAMARSGTGTATKMPQAAPGKGEVPVAKNTRAVTTGSVVVAGAAVGEAARQAGASATTIAVVIAAAIATAAFGWIAFRWRQRHKQDAPAGASS